MKLKSFNSYLFRIKEFMVNQILTKILYYFFKGKLIWIGELLTSELFVVS